MCFIKLELDVPDVLSSLSFGIQSRHLNSKLSDFVSLSLNIALKAELHGTNIELKIDEFCPAAFALRVASAQWLLRHAQGEPAVGRRSSVIRRIIRSMEFSL
ncbi:hypothetical protein ANAPRD1_01258 [Anaplasma phagocytophilum]|nr:hypothetical protein ANAPRD1_01258 [Anaplasma phagocytophilum]